MGTKKGRAYRASLEPKRQVALARRWSLDQIPHPRKGLKDPSTGILAVMHGLGGSPGQPSWQLARLAEAAEQRRLASRFESSEGWRPGLDLNQDIERCTALASTLSATGPIRSSPITPRRAIVSDY